MESSNVQFVWIGAFTRDYQLGAQGELLFEPGSVGVLGGGGAWALASMALWNRHVGAVARIRPDFAHAWINKFRDAAIDIRGLHTHRDIRGELVFGRYFENGDQQAYDPVQVFPL